MSNMVYLFISVLLGATAQVVLKKGIQTVGQISAATLIPNLGSIFLSPCIISGIVLYGTSLIVWLIVLSRMELSRAYPFVSLGYIITFILGIVLLDEKMSQYKILGLMFIVAGIFIMSRGEMIR
jgi:drug/metabolite transporter (DMT)-like permease